jgi:hypothetical protein
MAPANRGVVVRGHSFQLPLIKRSCRRVGAARKVEAAWMVIAWSTSEYGRVHIAIDAPILHGSKPIEGERVAETGVLKLFRVGEDMVVQAVNSPHRRSGPGVRYGPRQEFPEHDARSRRRPRRGPTVVPALKSVSVMV